MNYEKLQRVGWKRFFDAQLDPDERSERLVARVTAHHGSQIQLIGETDEFSIPIQLATAVDEVAVGDWLVLDRETHRILRRLERQSMLQRVAAGEKLQTQAIAANIDTIFLVTSCNEDFNLSRLERYLALILQSKATPVVVLSKSDLVENVGDLRRQVESLHDGLLVEAIDARDQDQVRLLETWCGKSQTVALLGSSGVGKSTLANSLGANERAVGDIRTADGKGRHTTTSRSLHILPAGGILIDNPGMRELQLPDCQEGVAHLFDELLRISEQCRFSDCRHQGDSGCAFPDAVSNGEIDERRFESFMKLNAEQAHNGRTLHERRERDRQFGRLYKSIMADRRQRRDL